MGTIELRDADAVRELVDEHSMASGEAGEAGKEYIQRMLEADNEVLKNQYGQAIVELIAPREMEEEVDSVIRDWDINPQGPSAMAQAPSFEDQQPEVAEGLTAWQFVLDDSDNKELDSTGYDLSSIAENLPCDVLWSKAPVVQALLPP